MDVVLNEFTAIYGVWNKDIPYYALGDVTFPYSGDSELIVHVNGSSRIGDGVCKLKIALFDGINGALNTDNLKYLVGKTISAPTNERGEFNALIPTGIRPLPSEKNGMVRPYTVVLYDDGEQLMAYPNSYQFQMSYPLNLMLMNQDLLFL